MVDLVVVVVVVVVVAVVVDEVVEEEEEEEYKKMCHVRHVYIYSLLTCSFTTKIYIQQIKQTIQKYTVGFKHPKENKLNTN